MKAVIGLLLIFTGLTVGYLVIAGKLPTTGATGITGDKPIPATGGGPAIAGYSRNFDAHEFSVLRSYHV